MQHWLDLAVERLETRATHGEVVSWFKEQHSHGHANAIVAYTRAELHA